MLARVRRSHGVRPLLGPSPTLAQIKELYAKRMPQYAHADHVVEAERRSDREVIDDIIGWLAQEERSQI